MDLRSTIEIILPVVVLLMTSQIAGGRKVVGRFATPQCNHNQLATAVGEMSTCETKLFHTLVERMLKNYKDGSNGGTVFDLQMACKITKEIAFDEGGQCPVNFANSCLPDYVAPFIAKVFDALEVNCDCPKPFGDPSCMLIDPEVGTKLNAAIGALLVECAKDPKCPSALFTYDNQCDEKQMGEALEKAFNPCLKDPYEQLANEIGKYFNGNGNLDSVLPCNTLRKVLDECFVENTCFSGREMEMVRNMAATIYHRGMDSLVLVEKEFGSLTEFVATHNELTLKWEEIQFTLPTVINISDPTTTKALDLADHIMKDYNTDACKENQQVFARMINGSPIVHSNVVQLILTVAIVMKQKYLF